MLLTSNYVCIEAWMPLNSYAKQRLLRHLWQSWSLTPFYGVLSPRGVHPLDPLPESPRESGRVKKVTPLAQFSASFLQRKNDKFSI